MHAGIETLFHQRNVDQAIDDAVHYLDKELNDPRNHSRPLRWDEPPGQNQDGSPDKRTEGNLPDRDACLRWLHYLLPRFYTTYVVEGPALVASEKTLFVKLPSSPGWSLEARLDLIMDDPATPIWDVKTTGGTFWTDNTLRERSMQAYIYMAAYLANYHRAGGFRFLQIRRTEEITPHEAQRIADEANAKRRKKTAPPVEPKPNPVFHEHLVAFDLDRINAYLRHVVRPRIAAIESESYIANPHGWWCSESFCSWWSRCAFGGGSVR